MLTIGYILLGIYFLRVMGRFLNIVETHPEQTDVIRDKIIILNMPEFVDYILYGLVFLELCVVSFFGIVFYDIRYFIDWLDKKLETLFARIKDVDEKIQRRSEAFYRATVIFPLAMEDGESFYKELPRYDDLKDQDANVVFRYIQSLIEDGKPLPPIFERFIEDDNLAKIDSQIGIELSRLFAQGY